MGRRVKGEVTLGKLGLLFFPNEGVGHWVGSLSFRYRRVPFRAPFRDTFRGSMGPIGFGGLGFQKGSMGYCKVWI